MKVYVQVMLNDSDNVWRQYYDDDVKNIGIGRNDMLCFVPNDFFLVLFYFNEVNLDLMHFVSLF